MSKRVKKNVKMGDIEIKDITQRTLAIIGMKGSGKTTALRILIREVEKSGLPVVAVDPTGSLRNKSFYNITMSVPYNKDDLETVVKQVWNAKAPLVLDISDMKNEQAVRFSEDLFEILFTLKDGVVVIDEIPDLTPQRGNRSEGLIRFNRKCRNKNIGFVFTTQRPAAVDKNVLALADMLFVMRVAWPTDVEVYEEHLKHMGVSKEERGRILTEIAHFGPGEVYILDFRTSG